MNALAADRIVFLWAHRNDYDCEYCVADYLPAARLRIQLDHAAAYLQDGRLVRLDTRRDGRFSAELAIELARLFALCGYIEYQRCGTNETAPAEASGRRHFHRDRLRRPRARSADNGERRRLRFVGRPWSLRN